MNISKSKMIIDSKSVLKENIQMKYDKLIEFAPGFYNSWNRI